MLRVSPALLGYTATDGRQPISDWFESVSSAEVIFAALGREGWAGRSAALSCLESERQLHAACSRRRLSTAPSLSNIDHPYQKDAP